MGKKIKIIILSSFVLFIAFFGGVFIYASKKINPEEVRKIALEQLEKTFPGANVKLGKVDYSLGFSVTVSFSELDIDTRYKKKELSLFSLKNLNLNIPVWSILFGGGTIEVVIDKPEISYIEVGKKNNWVLAMKQDGKSKKVVKRDLPKTPTKKAQQASPEDLVLPGFLSRSQMNLKLTNLDTRYRLNNGQKGSFVISKFLIKKLNFESSTAFELASNFEYQMSKKDKLTLDALIIGQFDLSELIKEKSITTVAVIKLKKVNVPGLKEEISEIKTDLNVKALKSGSITGRVKTTLAGSTLGSKFSLHKGATSLSEIKVILDASELVKIAGVEVPGLDLGKSLLKVDGSFNMTKKGNMKPSVNFELAPDFTFKQDELVLESGLKGSLTGKNLNFSSASKMMDGNLNVKGKAVVDINNVKGVEDIKKIAIDVLVANLNLEKKFLQKQIYGDGKSTDKKSNESGSSTPGKTTAKSTKKSFDFPPLPALKLNLKLNHLKIGGEDLTGKGQFVVASKSIRTKSLNFTFSQGKGSLTHSTKLSKKSIANDFNFEFSNLNLSAFNAVLPPNLDAITGIAKGKVSGKATMFPSGDLSHNIAVNINAKKGDIKGFNISEMVNGLMAKVKSVVPSKFKDKVDASKTYKKGSNFETLTFAGNFRDTDYHIKSFKFVGVDKYADMSIAGHVFPPKTKKESLMLGNLKSGDKKVMSILAKANQKTIPVRLKGPGFDMAFDYGYTTKIIAKSYAKAATKKVVAKVKSKAKKQVKAQGKKILKGLFKGNKENGGDKKNVKNLLKGLFN